MTLNDRGASRGREWRRLVALRRAGWGSLCPITLSGSTWERRLSLLSLPWATSVAYRRIIWSTWLR